MTDEDLDYWKFIQETAAKVETRPDWAKGAIDRPGQIDVAAIKKVRLEAENKHLREENELLRAQLEEANHWRERHGKEAILEGRRNHEYWLELRRLRGDNELLRAQLVQCTTAMREVGKKLLDVERYCHCKECLEYMADTLNAARATPVEVKATEGGLSAIFGKWPGNETDQQIREALEEID